MLGTGKGWVRDKYGKGKGQERDGRRRHGKLDNKCKKEPNSGIL